MLNYNKHNLLFRNYEFVLHLSYYYIITANNK